MEIVLCTNTYKRFAECVEMIKSAMSGDRKPDHILVCDNSSGMFVRYLEDNNIDPVSDLGNAQIIIAPENLGCARAWNLFLKVVRQSKPEAYVLISNDDIQFHADTIALFEQSIAEDRTIYVCGGMQSPNAFSLFMVHPQTLYERVGLFDENFKYPYCEDGDMQIRLWKAGLDLYRIPDCSVEHIGSATLKSYDEEETKLHHNHHSRNLQYLALKWGMANPNALHETEYDKPFDGDETNERMIAGFLLSRYGY